MAAPLSSTVTMQIPPSPASTSSSSGYSDALSRLARIPFDRSAYRLLTVPRVLTGHSYTHPASMECFAPAPNPLPPAPRPRPVPLPDVGDDGFDVAPDRPVSFIPPLLFASHIRPEPQLLNLTNHPGSDWPLSTFAEPLFTPPTIDALLAVPQNPNGVPVLKWDLADNPLVALLKPENVVFAQCTDLRRCAVRTSVTDNATAGHEEPLGALTIIVPQLPGLHIEVRHLSTEVPLLQPDGDNPIISQPAQDAGHLTLWDVLEGLHQALRAPLSANEVTSLDDEELAAVLQAAEARRARGLGSTRGAVGASSAGTPGDAAFCLRRIDILGAARRFLGIRPALKHEMPQGQGARSGAVFVVEVGVSSDDGGHAGVQ